MVDDTAPMYPAAFDYYAPTEWDEVFDLLERHGPEAKLLAGGCSLIPLMKLRLAEPRVLVDLRRVARDGVEVAGGHLAIGAMTRESTLERSAVVARQAPLLADASAVIADPLVRNMGTVGGNLAHADPANDHPAAMLAAGADVVARSRAGDRAIPIDEFFVDLYQTALEPGEVLVELRVPRAGSATGGRYVKLERQVGDFPIVGVAAWVRLDGERVADVRVGLTNVGPTAVRALACEARLHGEQPTPDAVEVAAAAAVDSVEPWSELRGSADYKLGVLPVIARRAILGAIERARTNLPAS